MPSVVQARLDPATEKALAQLVTRLGMSPSQVVREAIRLLAVTQLRMGRRRIVGLGRFESGVKDLASDKKHLREFGR